MHVRCLQPFPDVRPLSNQLRGNRVMRWNPRHRAAETTSLLLRCLDHPFNSLHSQHSVSQTPCAVMSFQSFFFSGGSWCQLATAKQVRPLQLKLLAILKKGNASNVCLFKRQHRLKWLLRWVAYSIPLVGSTRIDRFLGWGGRRSWGRLLDLIKVLPGLLPSAELLNLQADGSTCWSSQCTGNTGTFFVRKDPLHADLLVDFFFLFHFNDGLVSSILALQAQGLDESKLIIAACLYSRLFWPRRSTGVQISIQSPCPLFQGGHS